MGVIKLMDSGFIKSTNEGTQSSAANRANSGSAVTLKTAVFTPFLTRNVSNEPEIGLNSSSEVNLGAIENMQFQLECRFDSNDDSDMGYATALLDMIRTHGYKFLWYDYSSATPEKNNGKLLYRIASNSNFGNQFSTGEQSNFGVSGAFYHLHVHILEIQSRQSADSSMITYTIKGIVLPVEDSTI